MPKTELPLADDPIDELIVGMGMYWFKAISLIPAGWAICDGNNGTPDLTGLFLRHADADSGGTYDVADTDATPTHDHAVGSIAGAAAGSHTHTSTSGAQFGGSTDVAATTEPNHSHSMSGTSATNSSEPPWIAYPIIMYIG